MFKQTGYDVKELPDEDDKPHIDCNGTLKVTLDSCFNIFLYILHHQLLYMYTLVTLQVWRVNVGKLSPVPVVEQRKLYSGDCYTVQYTYSANGREERLFYIWLGSKSYTEDRADAISLTSVVVDSTKGDPVLVSYLLDSLLFEYYNFLSCHNYLDMLIRCTAKIHSLDNGKKRLTSW